MVNIHGSIPQQVLPVGAPYKELTAEMIAAFGGNFVMNTAEDPLQKQSRQVKEETVEQHGHQTTLFEEHASEEQEEEYLLTRVQQGLPTDQDSV